MFSNENINLSSIIIISVFISYDYGDTFIDKTDNFTLTKDDKLINSTVDQFMTHPKFNTVSRVKYLII